MAVNQNYRTYAQVEGQIDARGFIKASDTYTKAQIDGKVQSAYMGGATPTTVPNTALGPQFWMATVSGTYTNFGGIVVNTATGVTYLNYDGATWRASVTPIDLAAYATTASMTAAFQAYKGKINPSQSEVGSTAKLGYKTLTFPQAIASFNDITIQVQNFDTKKVAVFVISGYSNLSDWNAIGQTDENYFLYVQLIATKPVITVGGPAIDWKSTRITVYNSSLATYDYQPVIAYTATLTGLETVITLRKIAFLDKVNSEIAVINSKIAALDFVGDDFTYTIDADPKADLISGSTPYTTGEAMEFLFVKEKVLRGFTIPVVKDFAEPSNFTDKLLYKAITLAGVIHSGEITLAELAEYNALTSTSDRDLFDYPVLFPSSLLFEAGTPLQIFVVCVSPTDRIGSMFRNKTTPEPISDFYDGTNFRRTGSITLAAFNARTTYTQLSYGTYTFNFKTISAAESVDATNALDLEMLAPRRIYTVANDINSTVGYPPEESSAAADYYKANQMSAAVFLDHFVAPQAPDLDMKFKKTGDNRLVFDSKFQATDVHNFIVNNGVDVDTITHSVEIVGSDILSKTVSIVQKSTKNSATKADFPILFALGDSVTNGQYANLYSGSSDRRWRYTMLVQEFFLKDKKENGDVAGEYNFLSVGRFKISKVVNIKGTDYTLNNSNEAIAGISSVYTADVKDASGNFSMSAYLLKYRTMTDAGVRLASNDPAKGTLVTDVNAYDVCRPTHILVNLGLNDADVPATWYANIKKIVNDYKADYLANGWPVPSIVVTIPDTAGTIFPRLYKNLSDSTTEGNPLCDSRRAKVRGFIKHWFANEPVENEETNKVWFLPLFWVLPPGESCSFRRSYLPGSELEYAPDSYKRHYGVGSGHAVHVNALGHYHYAYQVYSWLKYSLAI